MQGKIINDPVYGFIHFPEAGMMQLIEHPWFQRLRRIKQMGMAPFVYPGAVHSRFHHSLGAAHLMQTALTELRRKGIDITEAEHLAARQAILLHDIGHGPFSHALEHTLVPGISHEAISLLLMRKLRETLDARLDTAIAIFENRYSKPFLHQLVSSQLDMDRMDYLNRDSFYTGVYEGVIGYDRILQMLTVREERLVVEEKGVHSVEKFIIARRLMYWQVYLHKTVLGAEQLIINILKRAKWLAGKQQDLFATPALRFFLYEEVDGAALESRPELLEMYCALDDADIMSAIKVWTGHSDPVLARLCHMLLNRRLYKLKLSSRPLDADFEALRARVGAGLDEETLPYFLQSGTTSNSTYNQEDEQIYILRKSGEIIHISQMDNALINSLVAGSVQKFYYYYDPELLNGSF